MKITDKPVVIEQVFKNPVNKVWQAITEIGQMRQWFFENLPDFKPEIGFNTQFEVQVEDRTFTHLWKVTEVIPLKKITYNWKYKEYPGDSFVIFELLEDNGKVNIRLTTKVIEDFPDHIPEFLRDSCVQGWHYFIRERLTDYMKKS
jgi:uncharacterized protein YndB with AHSA1/START domain